MVRARSAPTSRGGPLRPARNGGRVSRAMLLLILLSSVAVSALGLAGVGESVVPWLLVGPDTLPGLRAPALFMNTWVNLSDHPNSLFMPIALLALFRMRELPELFRTRWKMLLAWFVGIVAAGWVVNTYLVPGVWGILGALLITALMAPTVERMFGSRPFFWFCLRIVLVTNAVGATLLWLWPGSVMALLANDAASPAGVGTLTGAWFLTFALVLDRRTLDGLDFAINGRALALVLVIMNIYGLLFSGFASNFMDLLALGMAWSHVHPGGSPRLLLDRFHLWRLERRRARFKVVSGGRDDGRIVHRERFA